MITRVTHDFNYTCFKGTDLNSSLFSKKNRFAVVVILFTSRAQLGEGGDMETPHHGNASKKNGLIKLI